MIYLEYLIQAIREHKKHYNIQWPELPKWYQRYEFMKESVDKDAKGIWENNKKISG